MPARRDPAHRPAGRPQRSGGRDRPMNIVVCVKYCPDSQAERGFEESDWTTDRAGVDGRLSELDEYAVEAALQLVEAGAGSGGSSVTVLTMGPAGAADAIKKALQMG